MNKSELDRLYERASARDEAAPDARVRRAILDEARRLAALTNERRATESEAPSGALERQHAGDLGRSAPSRRLAGWPRAHWQIAAGLAAAALAVLVLQPALRSRLPATARPDSAPPARSAPSSAAVPRAPVRSSEMPPPAQTPAAAARARPVPEPFPAEGAGAAAANLASRAEVAPRVNEISASRAAPSARAGAPSARAAAPRAELRERSGAQSDEAAPEGSPSERLLEAAARGDAAAVRSLLQASAVSINSRDASGRTALLLAVAHRHEAIVRMLLENGADPNIGDAEGRTPLAVARDQDQPQMIDALLRAGAR